MIKHKLKKGYDIKLAGKTEKSIVELDKPGFVAMQPVEFRGIKPKLTVDLGSEVKIGSELFYDKQSPKVKFVSPASGKVVKINRGERRIVQEIVIESESDEYVDFGKMSFDEITKSGREKIIESLLNGGLWPYILQRPYSKIANPAQSPRDIFINSANTAPLAPKSELLIDGNEKYLEAGIAALSKLTEGKIYLSVNGNAEKFSRLNNVEIHYFEGPHPAGNTSVHIHHIKPINLGEIVWYMHITHVALIGKFFLEGLFPVERIIAVAGSSVNENARKYYKTRLGVPVQNLVNEGQLTDEDVRYISGNILNGKRVLEKGYLGFYDHLLTVIPESKKRELFGWLKPGLKEESFSRSFLSKIFPQKEYIKDTRIHGGKRAFIQTGEYEKVLPMDILPSYLVKSIIAEDIEEMIGLGLLEVDEEDFALCSYICPSKINFGEYIRSGLDLLEREG